MLGETPYNAFEVDLHTGGILVAFAYVRLCVLDLSDITGKTYHIGPWYPIPSPDGQGCFARYRQYAQDFVVGRGVKRIANNGQVTQEVGARLEYR